MKKNEVRLTQLASAAGCGAKIGPKVLAQVVGKLPKFTDPMLLCCQCSLYLFFNVNLISKHTRHLLNYPVHITTCTLGCIKYRGKIFDIFYLTSFSKIQKQLFQRNTDMLLAFNIAKFLHNIRSLSVV